MSNRLTPWQAKLEVEALINKLCFIQQDEYAEMDAEDYTLPIGVMADEIYWAQAMVCLETAVHRLEDATMVRNNRMFDDHGVKKDIVPLPIYMVEHDEYEDHATMGDDVFEAIRIPDFYLDELSKPVGMVKEQSE